MNLKADSNMTKNIKAVIFDFDGTLVDSLGIWKHVDELFFERRGFVFDEKIVQFGGRSFSECAEYIKDLFQLEESVDQIKQEWINISIPLYEKELTFKPYAKEFVKVLKAAGIKTAIGTSNNQDIIKPVLIKHNMIEYFDNILTCCEAGRGKPYPDIYLTIAENLQVKPDECIVFEDTLEGVLAGKNAGMFVYAVDDPHHIEMQDEIKKTADKFISGFDYFKDYFDKIWEII